MKKFILICNLGFMKKFVLFFIVLFACCYSSFGQMNFKVFRVEVLEKIDGVEELHLVSFKEFKDGNQFLSISEDGSKITSKGVAFNNVLSSKFLSQPVDSNKVEVYDFDLSSGGVKIYGQLTCFFTQTAYSIFSIRDGDIIVKYFMKEIL